MNKSPISKKFVATVFSVLLVCVMGIWSLYRLNEMMALQAFTFAVGSIVTIIIAFTTGNVIGDHMLGGSPTDKKQDTK